MSDKNHVKADNESLRGIGKLGWTEGGKMHSTIKKLVSTFDEDTTKVPADKKYKTEVRCPECKRKFKTNNGKVPEHVRSYHEYNGNTKTYNYTKKPCKQGKSWNYHDLETIKKTGKPTNKVVLNDETCVVGDKVAFTSYPHRFDETDPNQLVERTIEKLVISENGVTYIKFKEIDTLVSEKYFARNIIKL